MDKAKKLFTSFDMFSTPALLRASSQPQMQSLPTGFFSFLLFCIFTFIFVHSSLNVINYSSIASQELQTKIKSKEAIGYFQTFAVSLDFAPFEQFQKYFLILTEIYSGLDLIGSIEMKPCQPIQWEKLGTNYEAQFENNGLGSMYCPNTKEPFLLNQTFQSQNAIYVWVTLKACKPGPINPHCDPSKIQNYFNSTSYLRNGAAVLYVYVLDSAIKAQKQDSISYFINTDANAHITLKFGGALSIQFLTYEVSTDMSILPFEDIQKEKGILIELIHSYQTTIQDISTETLGRVMFTITKSKTNIIRKVGKIDEILSYAGGLFQILVAFFSFFLLNFNQYRYELKVAQGVFNCNQGQHASQDNFNIYRYIKFAIYDWLTVLFCIKLNWENQEQIANIRQEVQCQMQVNRLFKRIQNLQTSIKHSIEQNQHKCINLLQPPSLTKAKRQRMFMDYSWLIIGDPMAKIVGIQNFDGLLAHESRDGQIHEDTKKNLSYQNSLPFEKKNEKVGQLSDEGFTMREMINVEIEKKIRQMKVDEEIEQVEREISQCFYRLSLECRSALAYKIPALILYRLRMHKQKIDKTNVLKIQL